MNRVDRVGYGESFLGAQRWSIALKKVLDCDGLYYHRITEGALRAGHAGNLDSLTQEWFRIHSVQCCAQRIYDAVHSVLEEIQRPPIQAEEYKALESLGYDAQQIRQNEKALQQIAKTLQNGIQSSEEAIGVFTSRGDRAFNTLSKAWQNSPDTTITSRALTYFYPRLGKRFRSLQPDWITRNQQNIPASDITSDIANVFFTRVLTETVDPLHEKVQSSVQLLQTQKNYPKETFCCDWDPGAYSDTEGDELKTIHSTGSPDISPIGTPRREDRSHETSQETSYSIGPPDTAEGSPSRTPEKPHDIRHPLFLTPPILALQASNKLFERHAKAIHQAFEETVSKVKRLLEELPNVTTLYAETVEELFSPPQAAGTGEAVRKENEKRLKQIEFDQYLKSAVQMYQNLVDTPALLETITQCYETGLNAHEETKTFCIDKETVMTLQGLGFPTQPIEEFHKLFDACQQYQDYLSQYLNWVSAAKKELAPLLDYAIHTHVHEANLNARSLYMEKTCSNEYLNCAIQRIAQRKPFLLGALDTSIHRENSIATLSYDGES